MVEESVWLETVEKTEKENEIFKDSKWFLNVLSWEMRQERA